MKSQDDNWTLANSVQLTPAIADLGRGEHGVITARPHPTGWFVSARYQPDLAPADLADFAEFVRVRVYLLLENGPSDRVWQAADEDRTWRAVCTPSSLDLPDEVEAFR